MSEIDFCFHEQKKKNSIRHPQNGRFGDFETEPEDRIEHFFSVNLTYSYSFFEVEFSGNFYGIGIST